MSSTYSPSIAPTAVTYKTLEVDGLNIAYREAGDTSNPKLVLLHGFPSSSHQYRNLIPELAGRFHVISPDYPGFGNSDTPDPAKFPYTFDKLAEVVEHFLDAKGFEKFGLFVQDYGGPVGFRIVAKRPELLEWLIIQNTNAYEIGFTDAWGGLRHALWLNRSAENEAAVAGLLELETVKAVYLTGSSIPELISPDNWNSDYLLTLQRPHGKQIQLDLFYDYRTNVEHYRGVAGIPQAASAEDHHLLGPRRYLLHASGRRSLSGSPSEMPRCIGWRRATSRWKTASTTSLAICKSSTPRRSHRRRRARFVTVQQQGVRIT